MNAVIASTPATVTLQGRARRLRLQSHSVNPVLADSYRRRAAELDLQAWLEAVWSPPMDLGMPPPARAA
jgi:hypothetical protein